MEQRSVVPEPSEIATAAGMTVFTFAARDGEAARVTFHVLPVGPGLRRGRVEARGGVAVEFEQLVLP